MDVPTRYCTICAAPIAPERVVKRADTCSKAHAVQKKKEMREYRASKSCPTCGRPPRKCKAKLVQVLDSALVPGAEAISSLSTDISEGVL